MAVAAEVLHRLQRRAPQRHARWPPRLHLVVTTLVALTASLATAAEPVAVAANGKVHELTARSFIKAVSDHPWLFVEFYAPWCGHCKKLVPVWEKTAELAKDLGVPLAKVDATAEKSLAEENEVQSFPTLKLFKGHGKAAAVYNGAREAKPMIAWLRSWLKEPLLHTFREPSVASASAWAEKSTLALLGVASSDVGKNVGLRDVLEAASFVLNPQKPGSEVPVGEAQAVAGNDLATLFVGKVSPPAVVLFRKFDFEERQVTYSAPAGQWQLEPFLKWIAEMRVPALIPASAETEKFFLHNIDPGNGLLIFFGADPVAAKVLHRLAVEFRPHEKRLKWVWAAEEKFAEGLARSAGLEKADFPELCIWEFGETEDDDKVFRLSRQAEDFQPPSRELFEITARDFVKSWQRGELKVDKDPVMSVTSDTFTKYVLDDKRDVLVEFYAPWCQHCKSLAPEYKRVALHYASDAGIRIVKMDATKHKVASLEIKSYPTLKMYPRHSKGSPIDLPFKANREKQSLVDFVEEHRTGGRPASQKKVEKKAKEKKGQTQSAKPSPPAQNAHPGTPVDAGEGGVWAFDDSMQPQTRGQVLSSDMMASKAGHTLVRVGSIGVLITSGNPAVTCAVRRFDSAAAARRHAQDHIAAGQSPTTPPRIGSLPCPTTPSFKDCESWCAGVSAMPSLKLVAVVGGKSCHEKMGQEPPTCNCYDEARTTLHAMCVSPCSKPPEAPASKAEEAPATCAAGDASCSSDVAVAEDLDSGAGDTTVHRKFLLYDTKYGEGFNLQREVYPRAGWLVGELNKAVQIKCGSRTTGPACARWTLVLPPWCRVVHWWSGPELVPWSTFFDPKALRGSKVPVMEFDEFVGAAGGNRVDLAVAYMVEDVREGTTGGKGDFRGWTKELGDCATADRQLPQHEVIDEKKGTVKVMYSGHCDGGVTAQTMRCASLKSPWPQATLDMLSSLDANVNSVLLKNYDYLIAPDNDALDTLGLRESMVFSADITESAEAFIAKKLGGVSGYISVHVRRTDFLRVRTKTTPAADAVAAKINAVLQSRGSSKVFVATDAPDDLRDDLRKQVKGEVFFFDEADMNFEHPGKQAATEMWIAARSDFFIGTQESRFTSAIQLERGFLGKPKNTSEQEFCKSFEQEKTGKPCINPAHRHPSRIGAHREKYQ